MNYMNYIRASGSCKAVGGRDRSNAIEGTCPVCGMWPFRFVADGKEWFREANRFQDWHSGSWSWVNDGAFLIVYIEVFSLFY